MASDKSGDSNGQQRNVGNGIQVFGRMPVAYPKPLLGCSLESGIVPFAFRPERVNGSEFQSIPLDGKPVVVWDRHIFGTTGGLTFLVETFMGAGAIVQMGGSFIGTAIFLPGFAVLCELSVPVHGKASFADRCPTRQLGGRLCVSLVERNDALSVIKLPDGVVDGLDVIGFIPNERAFLHRQIAVGFLEDVQRHGRICHISGGCQLTKRKPCDAVYQHMAFVAPIEFIIAFIVLIGSGMDTQSAVFIRLWLIFRVKLVFREGLWVVLPGIRQNRCGIQPDKGRVQDSQRIELFDLRLHDFLKNAVIQLPQKSVICPIRGKLLRDIEATVVSDDTIIFQIIHQVGDVAEALALHDHKRADHGRYRITGAPDLLLLLLEFRQVKMKKQGVVERSLGL